MYCTWCSIFFIIFYSNISYSYSYPLSHKICNNNEKYRKQKRIPHTYCRTFNNISLLYYSKITVNGKAVINAYRWVKRKKNCVRIWDKITGIGKHSEYRSEKKKLQQQKNEFSDSIGILLEWISMCCLHRASVCKPNATITTT